MRQMVVQIFESGRSKFFMNTTYRIPRKFEPSIFEFRGPKLAKWLSN